MKLVKMVKPAYWVGIVVLVALAGGVVLSMWNTPLGVRLFAVQSGSMEPVIGLGSVVVVKPADAYNKGDVVTARAERTAKETVTHRVVEIVKDEELGQTSYRLKGDANEEADRELVSERRVIGKVVGSVPYLGYPVGFAQSQVGFIALIVIPATLIVYSEFLNIKKELLKLFDKKRKKKEGKEKEDHEDH